ncbi:uncharacterized protein C4orf36 homolog isoform X2 [Tachyglossus aculeatus]|uniref:uncharacterized protein C4orf36 homolog isoform X2 n=1 Tax=Tachyglossus aculeatus TaxID=9261 RepID=UPI0018F74B48|nr:uncharacterized protein C4orf36 homolog isoform X2 [Tachyglossus aculeatus]
MITCHGLRVAKEEYCEMDFTKKLLYCGTESPHPKFQEQWARGRLLSSNEEDKLLLPEERWSQAPASFSSPPSLALATEREYEQKRLKEIELRNKMANEIESLLKGKKGGLRKPLPPHHGQVLSEGLPLPPCPGETQTQDSPSLAHRPVQVTTGEGVISFST